MIRRQRTASIATAHKSSESEPLRQQIGANIPQSRNYKKKDTSKYLWGPIALFIGLLIFAFGGTLIIVLLTEHQTELPEGHSLFDNIGRKIGSVEETTKRMSRMERNIASTKSKPLSTEAKKENPNLLDMKKKPTELYAPIQHDNIFDDWFWGGNEKNDKKEGNPWEIDESNNEYQNLLKELFPHLYTDEENEKKDDDSSDKDEDNKKPTNPFGNLFGAPKKDNSAPKLELENESKDSQPNSDNNSNDFNEPISNQQKFNKPPINNQATRGNSQEKNTYNQQRETNTQPIYGQPNINQQNSNAPQNSYNQQEPNTNQPMYNNYQQNYQANPNAPPNYYNQQNQNTAPRNNFNNQQNYNQQRENTQYTNNQPQGDSQANNYNQQNPNYNQEQPNYNQEQPNYNRQQPNYGGQNNAQENKYTTM